MSNKKEEMYNKFAEEFPIERLENLSLEEYTNLEKSSFCYWLEFYTENLGSIRGRSSYKFGIYRCKKERKDDKKFISDGIYAWHKNYGNTAQEAFENIRKNIIEIAKNSSVGKFEKIDDIDLLWPLYKWKIAFLYSNKKLLPIYQEKGLKWIAKKQGLEVSRETQISQIQAFLMSKKGDSDVFSYAKSLWDEWLGSDEYKKSKGIDEEGLDMKNEFIDEIVSVLEYKKNVILQGAPGVGKTYNTAIIALKICGIDDVSFDNHAEVMKKYKELRDIGQIGFVTFHQSMDYEDFVEGIKPEITENSNVSYEVKDGIFKEICDSAKRIENDIKNNENINFSKVQVFKMSLGEKNQKDIYNYCLENNRISIGWGGYNDFSSCHNDDDFSKKDKKGYWVKRFKDDIKIGDIILVSYGNNYVRAIGKVTSEYFYEESEIDYCQHRSVEWLYKGENIEISKILGNKILSQKTFYKLHNDGSLNIDILQKIINGKINNENSKPYVLIIDEINRGNVSKIFGELITLFESDKRLGGIHQLTVTLPYSKKDFGIPDNLYIIGTMNTTDRSVGSIDYAVRRRFAFVTLLADESVIKNYPKGKELFEAVSKFIKDKNSNDMDFDDLMVGHSYFMADGKQLELKLKYEIIPLLEEYNKDGLFIPQTEIPEFKDDIDEYIKDLKGANKENNQMSEK